MSPLVPQQARPTSSHFGHPPPNRSGRRHVQSIVGVLLFAGMPLLAQSEVPAADFDIRGARGEAVAATPRSVSPAQREAVQTLQAEAEGDLVIRWSSWTGTPSRILRRGAPLTAPQGGAPQEVAGAFVSRHRALLGLTASDVESMRLTRDYVTTANGVTHLTLQQQVDGVDVWGGSLRINVDSAGRILNVSGEPVPDARSLLNSTTPALDADQALLRAAAATGIADPRTTSSNGLVYFPMTPTELRLAWSVTFEDNDSSNLYEAVVDASTGELLWRKSLTHYDHFPAHGDVYTSDSPIPQTPKGTGGVVVARQDVPFNGTGFFPHDDVHYDWWNGGPRTTTTSNNVDAYADRNGDNTPDAGSRPTALAGEDFSFAIDLSQLPLTYQAAAVTNLFYWNNRLHDWLYRMGFDEAAGNFQTNNFGLGGSGNDAVMAEAQDNRDGVPPNGPSLCNANFGTPPDGNPPRMQMFQCGPFPERDGDLDNNVIAHEYGHGVHSRLVPTSGNHAANEGWSDYFGLAILAEEGDAYGGAYGIGDYLFSGNGDGIRTDPYSTDPTVYKRTFADINDNSTRCQVKTCSDDPTETCTEDADCSGNPPATCDTLTGCKFHEDCQPPNTAIDQSPCRTQVHRTGELWANALWTTRMNIIGKYGFDAGDQTMNRLVIDGMKMSPADPTFLDGRDSILAADVANNGGVNQCLIWAGFARMGMGFSALTTDVLDINPVEAFDVPTGCAPVAQVSTDTDFAALCEGETAVHPLTIFNTGGGDLIVSKVERTSGSTDISVEPVPETPVFIGPDSHAEFAVRCDPSGPGDVTATITVTSNDTTEPSRDIVYSCSAGSPDLQVAIADSGSFGNVCAGDFGDLSVTLFNQGSCNLTIDDISVDDSSFLLPQDLEFPLVLSPDADFPLPIRFEPGACGEGSVGGTLTIGSDDPDTGDLVGGIVHTVSRALFEDDFESGNTAAWGQSPTVALALPDPIGIDLSGTSACPNVIIDPPALSGILAFPPTVVDVGASLGCFSDQTVNLRNNGGCPATIDGISASGADFSVIEPSVFPVILPSGEETLSVTVRFAPQADADPFAPSEVTGLLSVSSDDPDGAATADLCGESAAQSGIRVLVTDVTSGTPVPVAEVDRIVIQSKGQSTPSPIHLRFTDQPVSSTMICGQEVQYHVDREDLPETETTGNNPQSSYEVSAKEGNLQATDTFGLGQCDFKEFQLQLLD